MSRYLNYIKKRIRYFYVSIYICILIFLYIYQSSSNLPDIMITNPINIIEILTILTLTTGALIHLGITHALRRSYHLIKVDLGFKESITYYGAIFIFGVVLIILYYYYKQQYLIFLFPLILVLIGTGYYFGMEELIPERKKNTVTVKWIIQDTSGITILKILSHMELYQTTDTDYRFRYITGEEFIIPIGQIQEIKKP